MQSVAEATDVHNGSTAAVKHPSIYYANCRGASSAGRTERQQQSY